MTYQNGINAYGTTDHLYLELDLAQGVDAKEAFGALAAAVNLPTTVGANAVLGIRPEIWADIADASDVPANVHGFNEPIKGAGDYQMPATQHDAWLWIASESRSQCFEVGKHIMGEVREFFTIGEEMVGWVYAHNRDLTGFEDGTENPGALEVPGIIAIPQGEPGAGASVALVQKWQHLVRKWADLSQEKQESVIGRTREDSVELPEDVMPDSSHVSRTVVEDDGEELAVLRRNTSYGGLKEHGTIFIGFSFDQWRLEEMLRRMAGAVDGPRDALTYFTDVVTGSWYVCPSVPALLALAEPFLEDEDED
ncbi:Dyp-type peroxidase [Corynebacterium freiburgense]|uniref:Dyp-type peroxidase n=1 Tax=Corynebacterium freiburgense TaxID=556548 RepID=UPI00040B94B0|nr:Dyp-type peroxidase [Corynebacterium freiburgense]WJZ02654.1 putative deferrochelatase/peroxidase YfeX [Corynebacterium freiburgense]